MSDQPPNAGESSSQAPPAEGAPGGSREPPLIRQFVMDYLQQHGYDRILKTLNEGLVKDPSSDNAKEAGSAGDASLEAFFVAPAPIDLTSITQRNLPQAQSVSASTMSDRITPEFEAQAKYIIDMLEKRLGVQNKAAEGDDEGKAEADPERDADSLLDTSERVQGYRLYRQWVDSNLDMWKPELDSLSFPLFAHTYLDLMHNNFTAAARQFLDRDRPHHELVHATDVAQLASVTSKHMMKTNSFCQRLLAEKYTVCLSRNSHDLLVQWLSGAKMDEGWEAGMHVGRGRVKEAVRHIVFDRIRINVSSSLMPLDKVTLVSSTGLLDSLIPNADTVQAFNAATNLKLGPIPKSDKLKQQVAWTLADADARAAEERGEALAGPSGLNGTVEQPNGAVEATGANGQVNGHAPGDDVEMDGTSAAAAPAPAPATPAQPLAIPEEAVDPALVSPEADETIPPVPQMFTIAELSREVEAIRDKRRMIRLGPNVPQGDITVPPATVLPSVLAHTLFDGGEGVSSVEFSHDSSLLAVGSPESCIRLWSIKGEKLKAKSLDPESGQIVEDEGMAHRKLIGHSGPVYSLSFDPIYGSAGRPSTLLSSSQDGTVRLWSMDTYSNLVVYRGHGRDPVWDVEWGPMGVYFASASRDRTARLWSSDRVAPLRIYAGHLSDVNCVKFHPNSLYLASGSMDKTCRLWDVQRGACIRLFLGHSDAVTTMAISPDGKTLASAGLDRSIWLWDLGSSRPIKQMKGHKAAIHSLSFSAESSVLVSGSADSTVRVWDAKSAGGERGSSSARANGSGVTGADNDGPGGGSRMGNERGGLPMGPGDWDSATSDLMATFPTKRTPILKTHYTPRNLCMVAGLFVPPSNAQSRAAT